MPTLTISTDRQKQVVDVTDDLNQNLGVSDGVCVATVLHTTAALTTADLDPGTDLDMLDAFEKMIPKLKYRHPHNPEHVPDHILSTLIGPSVTLPISGGKLKLGTWQRAVLFEFDGPRERTIELQVIPA